MEKKQTNRVTMFKTVRAYLDGETQVWSGMAPLATAVQQFKDRIAAIDVAAQKQETPSGAADDKGAARDALEDVLFLICEALAVLGHSSNDNDLLALTVVTPTTLDRLDAEELSNRGASVLAEANARKAALAPLQVTQANIDELEQALADFNTLKTKPRTETAQRSTQTESLQSLIRDTNSLLRNQIDRMVNLFRRSNPDFVSGYRGARVIVDRAASHKTTKTPVAPPPNP